MFIVRGFRALYLLGPPLSLSSIPSSNMVVVPCADCLTLFSIYQGDSQPDDSTAGAGPVGGTAAREMSGALAPSATTSTMTAATTITMASTTNFSRL